jgi:hypothetical protein
MRFNVLDALTGQGIVLAHAMAQPRRRLTSARQKHPVFISLGIKLELSDCRENTADEEAEIMRATGSPPLGP